MRRNGIKKKRLSPKVARKRAGHRLINGIKNLKKYLPQEKEFQKIVRKQKTTSTPSKEPKKPPALSINNDLKNQQKKKCNPLIEKRDLNDLIDRDGMEYLGDVLVTDIIDYYIEKNGQRDKCCVFDNVQYGYLQTECYDKAIKKMYRERALNKDSIFAPMNLNGRDHGF